MKISPQSLPYTLLNLFVFIEFISLLESLSIFVAEILKKTLISIYMNYSILYVECKMKWSFGTYCALKVKVDSIQV